MISLHLLQVVGVSFGVALINFWGYGAAAEMVYKGFVTVFGRASYKAYLRDWKELCKAKAELSAVSAQDEFARWARLQRKIDLMQASFDALHSSRKRAAMTTELGLSLVLRAAVYLVVGWWGIRRGIGRAVEGVDLQAVGPLGAYLGTPYLERGQISVTIMLILGVVSLKHVLGALRP